MIEDKNQSNPDTGSADFFESLERQVNGGIMDDQLEMPTQNNTGPAPAATPENVSAANKNLVNWKKRYQDSSREATKMKDELSNLQPFVPLLNAMKQDSGLVQHVQGYLTDGGKPSKNIKEELGLGEDFVYDHDEALSDPDSKSARVFNAQVDNVVNTRVQSLMQTERAQTAQQQANLSKQKEAADFMKRKGMSQTQFTEMMDSAKAREMSLDDVYFLLNKDKAASKVARKTRSDMIAQAKNVRTMPATTANVNSPRSDVSEDDQVFDALMNNKGNRVDDLF